MINEEIVKQSIVYFNENKKFFFEQYSKGITASSNENSYKTVLAIKNMFENDVILNFLDKRDNQIYNDIDSDFIKNIIGGDFEIR